MKTFGLIGKSLKHSYSADYFNRKFKRLELKNYRYQLFEIADIQEVVTIIDNQPDLVGLNVTVPYKSSIIPIIDELDPTAAKVGAVNTVLIKRNNQKVFLKGFNTDVHGFKVLINPYLKFLNGKKVMVLGTGGASKAVCSALDELNQSWLLVSRELKKDQLSYQKINRDLLSEIGIIVNTTPLGMFPDTASKPDIPYELLEANDHILIDLVYNPTLTAFLSEGLKKGCKIENGLRMLEAQAEAAWKIWNDFQS